MAKPASPGPTPLLQSVGLLGSAGGRWEFSEARRFAQLQQPQASNGKGAVGVYVRRRVHFFWKVSQLHTDWVDAFLEQHVRIKAHRQADSQRAANSVDQQGPVTLGASINRNFKLALPLLAHTKSLSACFIDFNPSWFAVSDGA